MAVQGLVGRVSRRLALTSLCVGLAAGHVAITFGHQVRGAGAAPAGVVERGRYLVTVQDCNGCHTPFNKDGEPDLSRMLSGHPQDLKIGAAPALPPGGWLVAINDTNTAWSGPWGVSFTSNLTSDQKTGIGGWTEAMFVNAIRTGKHLGSGRPILPPMPWKMYAKLTDDDLKAVFAYLRTVPAISNRVPNPIPPKPAAGR
jgi:hypothetical protein